MKIHEFTNFHLTNNKNNRNEFDFKVDIKYSRILGMSPAYPWMDDLPNKSIIKDKLILIFDRSRYIDVL